MVLFALGMTVLESLLWNTVKELKGLRILRASTIAHEAYRLRPDLLKASVLNTGENRCKMLVAGLRPSLRYT